MMKPSVISRIIAVLIFGVFVGLSMYHIQTKNAALGREEYLKMAADSYDRRHADPVPPATAIARGIAEAGFSIGVYELAAFGIFKLFPRNDRDSRRRMRH